MSSRYLLILLTCFTCSTLYAQEVQSNYILNGVDDSVHYTLKIHHVTGSDLTTVSVDRSELNIHEVLDIVNVRVLAESFLEIQFRVRSGTGSKMRRSVLVCVSRGKIFKAMDFYTESIWWLTEVYDKVADSLKLFDEKSDYHATLSIKQTEDKEYTAVLFESTKVESKYDPSQNVSFENPCNLYFDKSGYFFYNSTKKLNKFYKIYSNEEHEAVQRFISAEVPCIKLYEKLYVLVDNKWCLESGRDTLVCL